MSWQLKRSFQLFGWDRLQNSHNWDVNIKAVVCGNDKCRGKTVMISSRKERSLQRRPHPNVTRCSKKTRFRVCRSDAAVCVPWERLPHQISISRLEMSLGSRQVVFRGLMTADLWTLSGISAIGVAVMTGAAASAPHRSSRSNHSKPVKWFWCMTFTFRGPLDLLSLSVCKFQNCNSPAPPESPFQSALCMHREPGNSPLSYFSH